MPLPEFDPEDDLDFLDEIDGPPPTVEALCAQGGVTKVKITPVRAGLLATMKVSGVVKIDGEPHDISVWLGLASGRPSTAANQKMWLEFDGEVIGNIDFGGFMFTVEDLPDGAKGPIMMAGMALERICYASNNDLKEAVQAAVDGIAGSMNALAADTWLTHPIDKKMKAALGEFIRNVSVESLTEVTITETPDVHLGLDVSAVTLDPSSYRRVPLRVFFAPRPEPEQHVHCFEIKGSVVDAHQDLGMFLRSTVPMGTEHHYEHALNHLHQVAHAAGEYAEATCERVVAGWASEGHEASRDEIHAMRHDVFKSALVLLNPLAWDISGEPPHPDDA